MRELRNDLIKRLKDLRLDELFMACMAEPVGTQESGVVGEQNAIDLKPFRDLAGMQSAGPPESYERVFRWGVTLTQRYFTNGVGHSLVGDIEKSIKQFQL